MPLHQGRKPRRSPRLRPCVSESNESPQSLGFTANGGDDVGRCTRLRRPRRAAPGKFTFSTLIIEFRRLSRRAMGYGRPFSPTSHGTGVRFSPRTSVEACDPKLKLI